MKRHSTFILITTILIAFSCKHKIEEPPACTAGTGGRVTIVAYANWGSTSIPNYFTHYDTAFIKFGATISPGTRPENYDIYFVGSPGEDHIHCPGLKCGDYFIYRTAWDSVGNVMRYGGYGISFADTTGNKEIHVAVN